jgi:8-oxo-dGTP pyrophosphatase MutT (NUDIX family)
VSQLDAPRLTALADAIATEAQNGTHWSKDRYDRERFARIRVHAAEILAGTLAMDPEAAMRWYTDEPGTITSKIGVSVAAFDAEGRMLLIQRRDNGLWAQPGGGVEYGETLAETARREVWEESGVTAEPTAILGIYEARRHGFQTIYHWQHLVFRATVTGGVPGPSDETLAAAFFTQSEALALPISPGHEEPIRDAFAAFGNHSTAAFFDHD